MVNTLSKTAGRKDHGSWEPSAPPFDPRPPPSEVPACPEIQHVSSDTLLNQLLGMQQQQQQQMTLLQQHMTVIQQQLAAQQQKIELQQQQQQARPPNYFLKLKRAHAPTFAGSRDPLEAEKWITEMEKFFQALSIPKDEWVYVAIPFLIAHAEAWFKFVRPAYEFDGRRIDWAQFRDIFFLNYFPATLRIEKEKEFFNLKQGSMTVIQYVSMFYQLGCFAPAIMVQERSKATRFEEGLNLNLREYMGTPQGTTYQEVLEQALRAEKLIMERNQVRDSKRQRPCNEQYEETEFAVNKKAKRAKKKAIQEDFDDSIVQGQHDEDSAGNSSLYAASEEQRKVDEKLMRLAIKQKKELEALHKRKFQLEKDLDNKHALQLDVERLRGQLNVLKEAEELKKLLIEKEEEMEDQASLNQYLIIKERYSNDELQDARKELINCLEECPNSSSVGIKRMGKPDYKPFIEAMKREYKDEAEQEKRTWELCSLWEEYRQDPHWHPTKVVFDIAKDKFEEVIDEEDERLKDLKAKYGDAVYNSVTSALREMNDYDPSRRCYVSELWNHAEGRKATLKEGVDVLLNKWRTLLGRSKK